MKLKMQSARTCTSVRICIVFNVCTSADVSPLTFLWEKEKKIYSAYFPPPLSEGVKCSTLKTNGRTRKILECESEWKEGPLCLLMIVVVVLMMAENSRERVIR